MHANYIVDLACALAENTLERFLLIVPNDGACPTSTNGHGRGALHRRFNGFEKICQGRSRSSRRA
ncbi:MAG: hypothetical protein ACLS3M_01555 [Collinsella sp.]